MAKKRQDPDNGNGSGDKNKENNDLESEMADYVPDLGNVDDVADLFSEGGPKAQEKPAEDAPKKRKARPRIGGYVPPSEDAEAEMRSLAELAGLLDEYDQVSGSSGASSAGAKIKKTGGGVHSQKEIDQAVNYLKSKQAEAAGEEWIYEDASYFEYIDEDAYYFSDREKPVLRVGSSSGQGPKAILFGSGLAVVVFVLIPITQFMAATPRGQEEPIQQSFVIPPPDVPPPEKPPPPPPPPKEDLEEEPPEPPKLSLANIELSLNVGTGSDIGGDFGMPGLDLTAENLGSVDIFDLAELDAPPRVLVQTAPQYPGTMRMAKIEGRVFVQFIVDETGRVTQPRVTQAPHEDLGKAAIAAVLKWKFEPPLKDGRAVRARMGIGIPFRL